MSIHPELQPIVGGVTVQSYSQFNYQVILLTTGFNFCAGFILSSKIVGTAAHCLQGRRKDYLQVGYGSLDRTQQQVMDVSEIHYHEKFDINTGDNDVGVLKIFGSFEGENVSPIPFAQQRLPPGTKVIVSGWGETKAGDRNPVKLRSTKLFLISNKSCFNLYREHQNYISNNMICAIGENSSTCSGDSGGPLVFNGTLVGIVSWGYESCKVLPSVFADVTSPSIKEFFKKYVH